MMNDVHNKEFLSIICLEPNNRDPLRERWYIPRREIDQHIFFLKSTFWSTRSSFLVVQNVYRAQSDQWGMGRPQKGVGVIFFVFATNEIMDKIFPVPHSHGSISLLQAFRLIDVFLAVFREAIEMYSAFFRSRGLQSILWKENFRII